MEPKNSIQKLSSTWGGKSTQFCTSSKVERDCAQINRTAGRFYGSISEVVCRLKNFRKTTDLCVCFRKNKKGILDRFEIMKPFLEVIKWRFLRSKDMTIQAATRLMLFGLFHSSHGASDERARTPQALWCYWNSSRLSQNYRMLVLTKLS